MSASGFTPRQRRVVLLMILIVVVVFALLTGFLVTSLQSMERSAIRASSSQVTACPTASPSSPPPATSSPLQEDGFWPQVRAARLFDQIAHQVEIERALSPRAEVPLSFLNEIEMEETLRVRYSEEKLRSERLPLDVLGLLPDTTVEIQTGAPAGIYVTEWEQLYVLIDRPENDIEMQTLLAHAYVHALQDQHFDLEGMNTRAQTTDERLALQALIEGDATLATALYGNDELSSADWDRLTVLIIEAEQPHVSDELADCGAWASLQRFPYHEGRTFAAALYEQGGWDAINSSYTNPPRSTEQVLHPSRYVVVESDAGQLDQPSPVVVPDLGPVLGEEWQLLVEDTLGEFITSLYLEQGLPEERARDIADGWDGDTLNVWQRDNGTRLHVWRTIWDTTTEALEYEQGLSLLIPQRESPVRPISPPRDLPGKWWEVRAGTVYLRRTGRYVLFVRAPDTNALINALEALP